MPVICHNFTQNAWKKDLCSNCFKSKEEHSPESLNGITKRFTSTITSTLHNNNNNISINNNNNKIIKNGISNGNCHEEQPQSIMKTETKKNLKSKRNVCFPKEESQVIGYGGEDWSDSEEFELSANNEDDDVGPDDDAERELQRLTKSNTDFNMVNSNLLNGDTVNGVETNGKKSSLETPRRTFAQLMLGKPQTDAEGKKQTLLVSVTPFGEQESPTSNLRKIPVPINNGSLAKNEKKSNIIKNKDSIIENSKPSVILKSFSPKIDTDIVTDSTTDSSLSSSSNDEEKSLLDEITETLEKNKSLIQMKNTKNEAQILDIETERNKENVPISNEFIKTKAECVFINGDGNAEKKPKNGLTRHAAVIKRDHEKPVIYQSYNLRNENEKPDLIEAKSPILVKTEIKFISEATANLRKADGQISKTESEENSNKYPEENLPIFNIEVVASRESAGEPDGRADPDIPLEPPALPLTPPPSVSAPQTSPDPRSSFLHNATKRLVEKPKVPVKPNKLLLPPLAITPLKKSPTPDENSSPSEIENPYESLPPKSLLSKQDSNGSDLNRNPNKRRAPKPPSPTDSPNEQTISSTSIYYRNTTNTNSDSPVVREKEKRERASSCSPKFRNEINSNPTGDSTPNLTLIPEPAPRRSLSLSQDNLINTTVTPQIDEKKKNRGRFSLKKFLRMGSNNISSTNSKDSTQSLTKLDESTKPVLPQPKPRLVIIHPTDLNGSNIEVLKPNIEHSTEETNQTPSRPCKPPPPPRNIDDSKEKNNRAPPPPIKTEELIRHQKLWNTNNPATSSNQYQSKDNIYANVGEVRAALTPSKPVRTASMREREAALLEAQKRRNIIEHNYESVEIRRRTSDHVYDFVNGQRSSSPECDSTNKDTAKTSLNQNGFARPILNSIHHQYCGSETESEIYSPYSFYGSEVDGGDDDSEWTNSGARTYKLRSRKGRSVVHKNLEDNYGAVVVANHEALAQVLEHMNQSPFIQPALRGLKTVANLRWTDFAIVDGVAPSGVRIGRRCFHTALWGAHHVTLALTKDQGSLLQIPALPLPSITTLLPITEFNDLVPKQYVTGVNSENSELTQATIAVLPWMQIDTIQSIGTILRSKSTQTAVLPTSSVPPNTNDSVTREAYFVLLQLINGLKCMQAQGIEELPLSLTSFALCRDVERDIHPRLCLLQGLSEEISSQTSTVNKSESGINGSLCECALVAIKQLLPTTNLTSLLEDLLRRERAVSLTQVKSILEFSLWGPSDVTTTTPVKDRELALQRWLDLERATVLHGLVRTRVQLTVFEECHLLFLVRSSARMMCEASVLLDSIENNQEKHC